MVVEKGPLRARWAGLFALGLALWPTVAPGQVYVALGACQAGMPNGAYELRSADGRLRAAGAFAHGRMTGTFIFWTGAGARLAVLPFDNDLRNGTVALWYAAPDAALEAGRRLEAPYVADLPHGIERSWHPGGAPKGEYRYEHGVLVSARGWTEAGEARPDPAARVQAAAEAESNEGVYATLLGLVRAHLPPCDGGLPARQQLTPAP